MDDPATLPHFVFVTVGSTRFDALVRAVDDERMYAQLQAQGFHAVVFQIGTGTYVPRAGPGGRLESDVNSQGDGESDSGDGDGDRDNDNERSGPGHSRSVPPVAPILPVHVFRRAPSIEPYLKHAGLVISHAGVGTLMETLRLGSPLIAVVNPGLMDDHQLEVCLALGEYVRTCWSPEYVSDAITAGPLDVPYPALDTSIFPSLLDEELTTALRGKDGGPAEWRSVVVAIIAFVMVVVAGWWQGGFSNEWRWWGSSSNGGGRSSSVLL